MTQTDPWHDIPAREDEGVVNAVIEIPQDSKIKYELDKETGMLKLDRFLYSAVHYPGDYGFIPSTFWEDGDPLDIIILTGRPVRPMTRVTARVIGVLRMVDDGEEDDKIIGVYDEDPRYEEFKSINDIPSHTVDELEHFFETYKLLQDKDCEILEILDRDEAVAKVEKSIRLYNDTF